MLQLPNKGGYRYKADSGSAMALMIAGVLPIFFVLFSVTIDVAGYYARNKQLQKIADESVLFAERFLPYEAAAEQALRSTLLSRGVDASTTLEVQVTQDSIDLIIRESVRVFFAELLGVSDGIDLVVRAQALAVPLDIALVMDIGRTLSPNLPVGTSWGDDQEIARFFEDYPRRYVDAAGFEHDIDPLLATQQCFNPLFSQVKRVSLQLVEFLANSERNNLTLSFFPGAFTPIIMKPYIAQGDPPVSPLAFSRYLGTFTDGDRCAAAAVQQRETQDQLYVFPEPTTQHSTWQAPLGAPPMVEPHIVPQRYDESFNHYLNLPQALWAQSTEETRSLSSAEALGFLESVLLAQAPNSARGNLVNRGMKLSFLVLGDLPYDNAGVRFPAGNSVAEIQAALDSIDQNAVQAGRLVELSILLIHPSENSLSGYGHSFSPTELGAFQSVFRRSTEGVGLNSRAFTVSLSNEGGLNSNIMQYLSRLSKRSVLGK
jgi:hypothetical protein